MGNGAEVPGVLHERDMSPPSPQPPWTTLAYANPDAGGGPSPSLMSQPSPPPVARILVLALLNVVPITALLQHGLERPPPQLQLQGL